MKKHYLTLGVILTSVVMLSGCETPTTQRYSISADSNVALKSLGVNGVGIGRFDSPATFDNTCRAIGPLRVSDNLTHTTYIQRAFEDELKVAGIHAPKNAQVVLTGKVDKLEFSSSKGITGGYWSIALTLNSSNGKQMRVDEYYEFESGFSATEACRNTAEAYSRTVQNLVQRTVTDTKFATLVK